MSREITKFPLITDNSSTKQQTSFEKQIKKIFRLSNQVICINIFVTVKITRINKLRITMDLVLLHNKILQIYRIFFLLKDTILWSFFFLEHSLIMI